MHNLIWVQLEAYGALNEEKNSILNDALQQIDYNTVNLSQTVCAAPSTVMTTMGLLTGVSPIMLAKDHIPKRKQVPDDWQAVGFMTITDFLSSQNYDVCGINAVFDSPRCLPMFKDTHAGVTPEMGKKEGYNFWEAWCIPQRLRNITPSLTRDKKSFFFHLIDADILPEIILELKDIGLNKHNTVLVLVGDHGWPIRFKEKEPALFHDLHQEENNIRVSCHIAYPGSQTSEYPHFSSALDLAPTALDAMGFDSKRALPKANGLSLINYLKDNSPATERLIRIDNRYIAQRKNKIITLVNSRLRYTFRYETNWEQQPYYQYRFKPVPEKEELYLRSDIGEEENLIHNEKYLEDISQFRHLLQETETEVLKHFYSKNIFEHYLLNGYIPDQDDCQSDRIHSSFRIQKILLTLLAEKTAKEGIEKVALYGAGNHTRSILKHGIINSHVSVIFDDEPLFNEINGIPVVNSAKHSQNQFDALVTSSDYFESLLKQRAEEWLPANKKLLTLYEEVGEKISDLLLEKSSESFQHILNNVVSICEPESTLVLMEKTKEKLPDLRRVFIADSGNFKTVVQSLPEQRFDLAIYESQNICECIEWLSRIDEILDSCGFFLAELKTAGDLPNELDSILPNDFKMEIVKTSDSLIILGHLWRFNS